MSVDRTTSRSQIMVYLKHIDAMIRQEPEIRGALVSTIDGFEIAARLEENLSTAKVSAMTSSLLALAEAMCVEGAVGDCRDLVIDAGNGRILLMDVPHPAQKLVLTVLCSNKVTLGQVLWGARVCRQELGAQLGKV
jgi:uncharacterized protein